MYFIKDKIANHAIINHSEQKPSRAKEEKEISRFRLKRSCPGGKLWSLFFLQSVFVHL